MTSDVTPWLARLAESTGPGEFPHAAAGLRAFFLYTALHSADQTAESADARRDELTALQQLLETRAGSKSRSAEAIGAVCTSLHLAEDGDASSLSRLSLFSAWLVFAQAVYDEGDASTALTVARRIAVDAEMAGAVALAGRARLLEGFIYIRGGDLAGAEHVLHYAEQLGSAAGEQSIVLRSRLGRANILWMRGNLPRAEAQLDSLLRAARGAAYDVLPTALLVRGSVAHARGKYADAVVWALASFQASDDLTQRARALTELASFLTDFPDAFLVQTAQRTLEYVAMNGPEQSGRDHAAINLIGLALDRTDVAGFRRWVAHLTPRDLRPRHAVLYGLYRAKGARIFALNDDRGRWLDIAEQTAKSHGFSQLSFDVEAEAMTPVPKPASPIALSPARTRVPRVAPEPSARETRVPSRVRRAAATVNSFLDAALIGQD